LSLGPREITGAFASTIKTVRSIKGLANGFRREIEQAFKFRKLHRKFEKKSEEQNMEKSIA